MGGVDGWIRRPGTRLCCRPCRSTIRTTGPAVQDAGRSPLAAESAHGADEERGGGKQRSSAGPAAREGACSYPAFARIGAGQIRPSTYATRLTDCAQTGPCMRGRCEAAGACARDSQSGYRATNHCRFLRSARSQFHAGPVGCGQSRWRPPVRRSTRTSLGGSTIRRARARSPETKAATPVGQVMLPPRSGIQESLDPVTARKARRRRDHCRCLDAATLTVVS